MTARLDLLAHGASAATRAARFPNGEALEASAVCVLEALRGGLRSYAHVLTAPARAARETAAGLGLDADVDTALRDCDYGRWRGLALKDVAKRESDEFAAWSGDPSATPHGGESLAALIERIGAWLAQSLARERATLAVTHASVVRAAVVNALGSGPLAFYRIDVAPLSLARLSGRDGRWNIVALGPLEALKRLLVALVAALLMSGRRRATLIGSVTGVIAATALVSAASLANAASVTGGITSIDMAKDTFTLDNGSTLHAPKGVKLTEFRVGQKVTAPYVRRAGHVDATAIKLAGKIPNNANLRG